MARDDMDVIFYKILTYFYRVAKAGEKPRYEDYCCKCKMFDIPGDYWSLIMNELINEGYLKGFTMVIVKGPTLIQQMDDASITYKGTQFLEDDAKMKEVKRVLGASFEVLMNSIIQAVIHGVL